VLRFHSYLKQNLTLFAGFLHDLTIIRKWLTFLGHAVRIHVETRQADAEGHRQDIRSNATCICLRRHG